MTKEINNERFSLDQSIEFMENNFIDIIME